MNPYANNQEVFDKAARHLLTQKVQAKANDNCLYRTPNGLACAIGGLIPDELYDPAIDHENYDGRTASMGVEDLINHGFHRHITYLFDNCDVEFLSALQNLHDHELVEDWHNKLADLAEEYELNESVLDEFEEAE